MGRKMPELWGVEYIRRRVGAENRQSRTDSRGDENGGKAACAAACGGGN